MKKIDYNEANKIADMEGNTKQVYPDDRKSLKPKRDKDRRFRKIAKLIKNAEK